MIQYGSICEHYKKYRDCVECSKYIKCPCGRTTYKCGFCKKINLSKRGETVQKSFLGVESSHLK